MYLDSVYVNIANDGLTSSLFAQCVHPVIVYWCRHKSLTYRQEQVNKAELWQSSFMHSVLYFKSSGLRILSATVLMQTRICERVGGSGQQAHFLLKSPSVTFHKPLGPHALVQQQRSPQGPAAGHRSMAVIREGNYTHNLFNGPQVQQRREAHKDPDQGGRLLHRWEQEVQEHISESFLLWSWFCCCF